MNRELRDRVRGRVRGRCLVDDSCRRARTGVAPVSETCQELTGSGRGSVQFVCGQPIKAEGLCWRHLAGKRRSERAFEARQRAFNESMKLHKRTYSKEQIFEILDGVLTGEMGHDLERSYSISSQQNALREVRTALRKAFDSPDGRELI